MKPHPAGSFLWVETSAGAALICRPLQPFAAHLFTTRQWMLGSPTLDDGRRRIAWRQLAEEMGRDDAHLARLHQVHGPSAVVRRAGDSAPETLPHADVIVSTDPALALAIQTADCAPILIADRMTGAVGAAHAGWRGLAAGAPAAAVRALVQEAGSSASDLIAAIGPAISAARYEVGGDVRAAFETAGFTAGRLDRWFRAASRPHHWLFDGWESARAQLEDAGIPAGQIHVAGLCTATYPDLFCSYRRDGKLAGRMAAAIAPIGRSAT
jgi:YfiH family protein